MGLYSVSKYGIDTYGTFSRIQYSAEPFTSTAINYTQVQLSWAIPGGEDISELRLLRSNDGFPETPEDGKIIYFWEVTSGLGQEEFFLDGTEVLDPVPSGKFVYYRIWVKTAFNKWRVAADTFTLVPIRHSSFAPDKTTLVDTKNKLLDILPRVYTTASQSPTDEVDPNSDLAIFLDAFSFELDRSLTYADLLLPTNTGQYVSPEILSLQSAQFGIEIEPYVATKQQRKMVRNALPIYKNKGTLSGIEAFVESYTGFSPTITKSPNLVLSTQDSTFTNGVGFWKAVGDATIVSETTIIGIPESPTEPYIENNGYVGKVTVNQIGSKIVNGVDNPVTQGTPVNPGTAYIFSGYAKSASGNMGVKGYLSWYDLDGNFIEVDPPRTFIQTPQLIADSDWEKFEIPARSPGVIKEIISYSITSGVLTLYLNDVNTMVRGETIVVSGISSGIDGVYQIEANGITPETLNQVYVATAQSNTSGIVISEGLLREANPKTETFTTPPTSRVVMGGEIVDGVATVTFAAAHGLNVGDKIVIQAMSTAFSFGVHTITPKTDTTVTFQIYIPYTFIENEELDESFAVTGTPYGFAVKILTYAPEDDIDYVTPAHYVSFELEFTTTGILYIDLLSMATFDVPEYHQPRAVEIFLNPNKTNYLLNPGFQPSTLSTTWDVTAEDFESVDREDIEDEDVPNLIGEGYVLKVESTIDGETSLETITAPVNYDVFITCSFYAITTSTTPVNLDFVLTAVDSVTEAPIEGVLSSKEISVTNAWTRFSHTILVPAGEEESASIKLTISGNTDSEVLYFDRAQIESSFKATDYFAGPDGVDLDLSSADGAFWEGTPYNSPSHLYVNFDQKIDRLVAQLPKYLPTNLSFLIRWYGGGVAKPVN
jgi:hypothetical protein